MTATQPKMTIPNPLGPAVGPLPQVAGWRQRWMQSVLKSGDRRPLAAFIRQEQTKPKKKEAL